MLVSALAGLSAAEPAVKVTLAPSIPLLSLSSNMACNCTDSSTLKRVTKAELLKIQDAANRIVMAGKTINKSMMEKSEAEHAFVL